MLAIRVSWLAVLACACSTDFPAPQNHIVAVVTTGGSSTSEGEAPVCNVDAESMSECVDPERYIADLTFVAGRRPPGDAHWQEVQDMGFDRLTELGFELELHQYGSGINVIGTRAGTRLPDELVVVSAHYDHIPGCDGADDNATGVAGALELARILSQAEFERTLVVALWDQEEIGLIGSRAWAFRASQMNTTVHANFNFEMIGYADSDPNTQRVPAGFELLFPDAVAGLESSNFVGDFLAVVSDETVDAAVTSIARHAGRYELPIVRLDVPTDLKNSPLIADLRRSDHASMWEFDFPAMMLTDTSNFRYSAYHCADGEDTTDKLDHEFATKVLRATAGAIVDSLGIIPPLD